MSELKYSPADKADDALPALTPEKSPFWPQNLVDLFFRPKKFFSENLSLGKTPYALFVGWILGVSSIADSIDQRLVQADLGRSNGATDLMLNIADSWPVYLGVIFVGGILSGAMIWYIGGWWCKVRLKWSGAADPDPQAARLLLIYSSFVFAAPHVVTLLLQVQLYENYLEAYAYDEFLSFVPLIMLFWSIATTYKGAIAMFDVKRWRAMLWFAVLPTLYFLIIMGVFGYLFAVMDTNGGT